MSNQHKRRILEFNHHVHTGHSHIQVLFFPHFHWLVLVTLMVRKLQILKTTPLNLILFSVTLNKLHLWQNNTDTNLATYWPSCINAALCSQAEHLSAFCFGLQHQPKALGRTESSSFPPPGICNASLFMLWPSASRSFLTAGAGRWQRSSGVRGGLTQLGPGNSSFP